MAGTPIFFMRLAHRPIAPILPAYTAKMKRCGARRGSRIQKGGGGRTFRKGGGVRTGISGADPSCCRVLGKSTSKKKLQTAVGGVSDHPKKKPVSAHAGSGRIA